MLLCCPLIPYSVVHLGFHHIFWRLNHLSCLAAAGAVKRWKGQTKHSSNAPSFSDDDGKRDFWTKNARHWQGYAIFELLIFSLNPQEHSSTLTRVTKDSSLHCSKGNNVPFSHSDCGQILDNHWLTVLNRRDSLSLITGSRYLRWPRHACQGLCRGAVSLHLHDGVLKFRTPPVWGPLRTPVPE